MAGKRGPAFLIRLGVHRALVVNNWEVAKECFTANDKVFPISPKSIAVKYMGQESNRFQKAFSDFFYLAGLFLVSKTIPFLGWLDVVMGNISKIKRTAKELDFAIGSWSLALGGIDTNVATLSWAISLLLNNRHVLMKAQEKLDIHVGKQQQVEKSDIANLLHRDPGIWHKPLDFLLERFLGDHANIDVRGQNFQFIPFGAGRRICPGITFALHFQHPALARLLYGLNGERSRNLGCTIKSS
ncbi:protopine 6-monooxygenase-like [Gossypium hirsutum]|uniref:Protopine 6-monooxygenase-like n=1 Tax=Gossypium hirsutum TaxID=3635 RepID=A0A1U8IRN3_GOSHI|nr:protopine 6-monooxygenase-like [Gossypium hirsutum]